MRITIKSWKDICQLPEFTYLSGDKIINEGTGYQLKRERYELVAKLPQPVFAYRVNRPNVPGLTIALCIKVDVSSTPVLIPIEFVDKIVVE